MKPLRNDLLFAFIKCFFQIVLSVIYSPLTAPWLGKRSVIHVKGEILGEFKDIYIFMSLTLAFFLGSFSSHLESCSQTSGGYEELGAALRVGASCSGKAKQEQGRAQGRMTQASCSHPQGGELLFLVFFGFILPEVFKLLDLRLPGENVSLREEVKLASLLLLVCAAQGFRATEVLSVYLCSPDQQISLHQLRLRPKGQLAIKSLHDSGVSYFHNCVMSLWKELVAWQSGDVEFLAIFLYFESATKIFVNVAHL